MRTRVATSSLALLVVLVTFYALTTGDYPLAAAEVFDALIGQGSPLANFIVGTLRLPRIGTALLVGAALGVAGAILQRLSRNPLASPDIIGLTAGSATGAIIVILAIDASLTAASVGALIGGLVIAVLTYGLALSSGYRLVLVGIGLSAMLLAVNSYLITRATAQDAASVQVWLIGSLTDRPAESLPPMSIAIGLLLLAAFALSRRLGLLEMGDDFAAGLGVAVGPSKLMLTGICVALTAIATAATGPIAFIALTAPQISARLTRSPGPGLTAAALTGAFLLAASDLLAQRILPGQLPVGVLTGLLGGGYLAWLLVHEWRRSIR